MDENAQKIKLGSVVRLKSGGPTMTVTAVTEYDAGNTLMCEWFEINQHQVWEANSFSEVPPEALDLINELPEV